MPYGPGAGLVIVQRIGREWSRPQLPTRSITSNDKFWLRNGRLNQSLRPHPILRGIRPWTYEQEEFFFKEKLPEDPRRTPLLTVTRPEGGDAELVSWAVERSGGGRGFVFTGSDFHANMSIDEHRRMLAQCSSVAAKVEVPAGAVSCQPTDDLLK
jgi:hypothetical protein